MAAGIWSRKLVAGLGLKVLMEAERGYHVMIEDPGVELPMPTMLVERSVVLTPMEHGLRITGIAEFCDADAPPTPGRAERLLAHARACIPGLRATSYTTWVGPSLDAGFVAGDLDASTPSARPLCVRSRAERPCDGRITGKLVAELVGGRAPSIDVAPFSIQRFN